MWINVPGLIMLVTICSLAGMVVYAEYRRCDPLATDRIHACDQVLDSNFVINFLSWEKTAEPYVPLTAVDYSSAKAEVVSSSQGLWATK